MTIQNHFRLILPFLLCVSLALSLHTRHKRLAFHFPTSDADIDWGDDSVTVPTLDAPPNLPPLNYPDDSVTVPTSDSPTDSPPLNYSSDSPRVAQLKSVEAKARMSSGIGTTQTDSNSKTTTPPKTISSSPAKEYRYNCPILHNFCIYVNPCNERRCAMNLHCTNYVCVGTPYLGNFVACPSYQSVCVDNNPCRQDQRCSMNTACTEHMCLDVERTDTTTAPRGNCTGGDFECGHGYCLQQDQPDGGINSWCVCDKGWTAFSGLTTCNVPCTLDCIQGSCRVHTPGGAPLPPENVTVDMMECNCMSGWEGTLCQHLKPDLAKEARQRTLKLAISMSTVLLLVILVAIVFLFILWRKRVIVVMKLVYYFKVEEADDGRLYDAYISMGTSHRGMDFVKDKLCPHLQGLGFRIYIQARDQMLGEVLSESIHKTVEQSRRTILILTPEYIRNEWSNFECIVALMETLRRHQRIIPIVLEDISTEKQTMNKTLKHILESVNCLKFPIVKSSETLTFKEKKRKEDKFWERLKLTMPKKRKCCDKEPETEISELEDTFKVDRRPIDISTINVAYSAI